jgi:dTMP kinase
MSGGRLITLEGGEGAGKSTQAAFVEQWLRARGRQVLRTREPGGTPLAEAIRELVLADWEDGMPLSTEVLLMFAARAAHWEQKIAPTLAADIDVVCDRFLDSSYAYQGSRGVPVPLLDQLAQASLGARRPDLTLLLDLPAEQGLARARQRGGTNRFEAEALSRQQAIRERFLTLAAAAPERVVVIDAREEPRAVSAAVAAVLEQRL